MKKTSSMMGIALSTTLFSISINAAQPASTSGNNQSAQYAEYHNHQDQNHQYQNHQYQNHQYQNQQYQHPQYQNQSEGGYYAPPPAYYPAYPGYLAPGPVDPGEDEADEIYRENQHPPR